MAKSKPPRTDQYVARHLHHDPVDSEHSRALDSLWILFFTAGIGLLLFVLPGVPVVHSAKVILVAAASAVLLVALLLKLYEIIHRQRKRVAPDEPSLARSMPRSTQDAPLVPDHAPTDPARPAPGQSAAE